MEALTVLFNFMMKYLEEILWFAFLWHLYHCRFLLLSLFNSHHTVHLYYNAEVKMCEAVPSFLVCLNGVLLN